jgi:DNA-binding XRE family transcriptional regulator
VIHIDFADGSSRWLTKEQLKEEFPAEYAAMYAPRPFSEAGELIKKMRQKADMTVRELAKAAGIGLADMSAIETGRIQPTQEQLDAIGYAIQRGRT